MAGIGEAVLGELIASTIERSASWLYRSLASRPGESPLTEGELRRVAAWVTGQLQESIVLDDRLRGGLDTYLRTADFRLLADHLLAAQLSGVDVDLNQGGLYGRMFKEGLRRYAPDISDVKQISLFAMLAALSQNVAKNYLPHGERLAERVAEGAYRKQIYLYTKAIESHLDCLRSRDDHSVEGDERFMIEAAGVAEAVHSQVVPPNVESVRKVPLDDIYIAPTLTTSDNSQQASGGSTLEHFTTTLSRAVVLGDPGGGKSTLAQKIVHDYAAAILSPDSPGVRQARRLPVLVVLRDFASRREEMSFLQFIEVVARTRYQLSPPDGTYERLLVTGQALVVFDGLDELLEVHDRTAVASAVEAFCARYPACPVLITSRKVGYREAPLDDRMFETFELGEFNDEQVRQYVAKWFKLDRSLAVDRCASLSDAFMSESQLVSDLRSNPLLLALMCTIYKNERYIPRNRPDVYEKCALMLFERWDRSRGIRVPLPFEAHVGPAMRFLAHWIYGDKHLQAGVSEEALVGKAAEFLERRFEDVYEAKAAARDFVEFCKGRAWVFRDTGSSTDTSLYQFTHRTFLEYFTASHLTSVYESNRKLVRALLPRIRRSEWDVVVQLAVQISAKQRYDAPDETLAIVIKDASASNRSWQSRHNLAEFCLRVLSFLVPRPATCRDVIRYALSSACDESPYGSAKKVVDERLAPLASVARENHGPCADEFMAFFDERTLRAFDADALARLELALSVLSVSPLGFVRHDDKGDLAGERDGLSRHEVLVPQRAIYASLGPSRSKWIAIRGLYNRFYSVSDIQAAHGPEILFSHGAPGDGRNLMMAAPSDLAMFHLYGRRANYISLDPGLSESNIEAAESSINELWGKLEHAKTDDLFGGPAFFDRYTSLGMFADAELTSRQIESICLLLAALHERDEITARSSANPMPHDQMVRQVGQKPEDSPFTSLIFLRLVSEQAFLDHNETPTLADACLSRLAQVDGGGRLLRWTRRETAIWTPA